MRRLLALTLLQRGLAIGTYLVATMIIARLLTPAEVGVFSLSAAVMAIAGVVREFGISEYLMQEKQLDERRVRASFGTALVVAWSVAAVIVVLRHPIARFYGEPGVADVLLVLALTFLFLPLATPVTALLYREMQIARVLWIQTIALVLGHAASVALAWAGYGYMALAWGTVVNSACMVVVLLALRPGSLRVLPSLRGAGPIWSYCGKFTASGALETGGRNVHEFIIGRVFGFAALGLYSRANGLFVQFNQNVGRGISRVLLPGFARQARTDAGALRGLYGRTLQLYTGVVWPMYAVAAVLAEEVILVMFGDQWLGAAPLLQLLCIGAVVQAGYAFAGELLGAMGQPGARLRIMSVGTPLWVGLCAVAAFVSLEAVAFAYALHSATMLVLFLRQVRRLTGFTAVDWVAATRTSVWLALLVAATVHAWRVLLQALDAGPLVTVVSGATLAAIAWFAWALLLSHPCGGEARNAIAGIARRLRAD